MKIFKAIGKGFIEAHKEFWRDMKAVWKQALITYIILMIISYFTGKSMETVLTWFVGCVVGFVVFVLIYASISYFVSKRKNIEYNDKEKGE